MYPNRLQRFTNINTLFYATEFFQSFGIFGFKFFLILYLTNHLGFADSHAYQTYAAFAALAYGLSSLAGVISERYIGVRQGMYLGSVFMFVGFCFALSMDMTYFFLALSFVIWGTSFYRTTAYDLVGKVYKGNSHESHLAYNNMMIFTNSGGLCGLIASGFASIYSMTYAFIVFGVISFISMALLFATKSVFDRKYQHDKIPNSKKISAYLFVALGVLTVPFIVYHHHLMDFLMPALIATIFMISYSIYRKEKPEAKAMLRCLGILYFFLTCFNTGLEQLGGTLNLYIDRAVDSVFFGFEVPTPWFVSSNLFFYAFVAFVLSSFIAGKAKKPCIGRKFLFAYFAMIIGFTIFYLSTILSNPDYGVFPAWVVGGIFFYTVGEAVICPVSLAMITILAPKKHTGFFMGIWFLCYSWANYFSGEISKFVSVEDSSNVAVILNKYSDYFLTLTGALLLLALMVYLFSRKIDRVIEVAG